MSSFRRHLWHCYMFFTLCNLLYCLARLFSLTYFNTHVFTMNYAHGMAKNCAVKINFFGRFHEITTHYQLQRRVYPFPHARLDRAQAVHYRQLQTDSYMNPRLMHTMYSDMYTTNRCTPCGEVATRNHMLWEFQDITNNSGSADTSVSSTASLRSRWKTALLSSNLTVQLSAVQRAEEAASRQGLGTAPVAGAQTH